MADTTANPAEKPSPAPGAGAQAPAAGVGEGDAQGLAKLIKDTVEASLAGYKREINGEQAKLRKRLEALSGGAGDGGEKPEPPKPASQDDLIKIVRELGKLEASVGEEVIAELGDEFASLPPAQQVTMLRMVAKVSKKAGPDAQDRGGNPPQPKPTARASVSAPRDSVPRPRTMAEYIALAKDNPALKKALDADPTFDPSELARY